MGVRAATASIVTNERKWAEEAFGLRQGQGKRRELVWQKMIIKK